MNRKSFLLRFILLQLILVVFCLKSFGQINSSLSPYDCMYNHLYYLQDDSYAPFLSANSFSAELDSLKRKDLAVKLKQIYDGKGLFVQMETIPDKPSYFDSIKQEAIYFPYPNLLPNIYMVNSNEGWHYSDETSAVIPNLHSKIYPIGSEFLLNLLPVKGSEKILGLFKWQYLGLALLLLLTFLLFFIIRLVLKFLYKIFGGHIGIEWKGILNPLTIWVIIKVFGIFLPVLLLPVKIMEGASVLLSILSSILVLIILLRLVNIGLSFLDNVTQKTESKMDEQLLPVLHRGVQFVIIALWILYFLSLLGVNITALVAGISIGGLAVALAAQDTLKNLFGSITIFLDKPFQIGDWVRAGDAEGTVEEVGFRSTRIRSFTNSLIYVPNSKLTDATVDNFGLRNFRRYKTMIGLTYNTPPVKIDAFVKGLRAIVENHPYTKKDAYEIHLNNMGASALEILFYIFFEVETWTQELESKHNLLMSILKLAEDLGVSFAYPSTSVYLENSTLEDKE